MSSALKPDCCGNQNVLVIAQSSVRSCVRVDARICYCLKPGGNAIAGRIQRNRAGVSWHTTLVTKSSVLYLCAADGSWGELSRLAPLYERCPCGAATATKKGWQFVPKSIGCQPFAVCGTKVYKAPPQRIHSFSARSPLAFSRLLWTLYWFLHWGLQKVVLT